MTQKMCISYPAKYMYSILQTEIYEITAKSLSESKSYLAGGKIWRIKKMKYRYIEV